MRFDVEPVDPDLEVPDGPAVAGGLGQRVNWGPADREYLGHLSVDRQPSQRVLSFHTPARTRVGLDMASKGDQCPLRLRGALLGGSRERP